MDGSSRKDVKAAARALRSRPGWDPSRQRRDTDEARLEDALTADRGGRVYAAAGDCASCAAVRAELGDETALCEEHLLAAMG